MRRLLAGLAGTLLILMAAPNVLAWGGFDIHSTCKPDADTLGWYIDAPAGERNYIFEWSYGTGWTTVDLGSHVGDLFTPETSAERIYVRYRDDHRILEDAAVRHVLCEQPDPTPTPTPAPTPTPTSAPTPTPTPSASPSPSPSPSPTATPSAPPSQSSATPHKPSLTLPPTATAATHNTDAGDAYDRVIWSVVLFLGVCLIALALLNEWVTRRTR